MPASISDNNEKVVFQCDLVGNTRRIRKTSYMVFETQQDNQVFQVDLMIRMKTGFIKNGYDLIKNDHMIFQKRGAGFFFLFEADKKDFTKSSDEILIFEEEKTTSDYDYRILIQKNLSASPKTDEASAETGSQAALNKINAMLKEHGITDSGSVSPVDEFMKSWKLGHPDEE